MYKEVILNACLFIKSGFLKKGNLIRQNKAQMFVQLNHSGIKCLEE